MLGFDNLALSEMITPALTTVDQCTREIGAKAIELLTKSFADPAAPLETVSLQAQAGGTGIGRPPPLIPLRPNPEPSPSLTLNHPVPRSAAGPPNAFPAPRIVMRGRPASASGIAAGGGGVAARRLFRCEKCGEIWRGFLRTATPLRPKIRAEMFEKFRQNQAVSLNNRSFS